MAATQFCNQTLGSLTLRAADEADGVLLVFAGVGGVGAGGWIVVDGDVVDADGWVVVSGAGVAAAG
jgi:hypothetical protein